MSLGGFSGKFSDFASQKPTKQCKRCGLNYPKDEAACSHCGGLGEQELIRFKAQIDSQKTANKSLGGFFIILGLLVMFLLFLTFV